MLFKKGAMFGLDARIALAIFGALSVISGAALYSAIQNAKATSAATRIIETGKAFEAYLLDVGQAPEMFDIINLNSAELVSSTKPGWKGPYISHEADRHLLTAKGNPAFQFFIQKAVSTGLGGVAGPSGGTTQCSSKNDCYYWLKSHIFKDDGSGGIAIDPDGKQIALALEEKIDNNDGLGKGRLRINYYNENSTDPIIFYQIMPVLN